VAGFNIYKDIAERTNGDIYIGVVGPVRTGKSTFIRKFMEQLVIPNIENVFKKERAKDELPQGATGKTIMTTEPKFVPNEAIEIFLDDTYIKIRMIDCVGYFVKGAVGHLENEKPRMVSTPWFDHQIPFQEAAEIGTRKVITEHSTIGIVVTTDGSFTGIPRENYVPAEERVIRELNEIGKPFIVILNTTDPDSPEIKEMKSEMEKRYNTPVIPLNVMNLTLEDIQLILKKLLFEFPVKELNFMIPSWIDALDTAHWFKKDLIDLIKMSIEGLSKLRDIYKIVENIKFADFVNRIEVSEVYPGGGNAYLTMEIKEGFFLRVLSEISGLDISGEDKLLLIIKELAYAKKEYDRIKKALTDVREKGYGIVPPILEELTLEEPEIVRQGNRFGVRLKASAPSLHLIRADVETEVLPIIGTEKQSEEFVKYLLDEFENDPSKLWNTNIFGKSLHDLVKEGLKNKLNNMPENAQIKLQQALTRIVNEGSGNLICIIL